MAVCFSISRPTTCALNFLRAPTGASALKMSSVLVRGTANLQHVQAVVRPGIGQMRCLATQKEIDENLKKYSEGKFDTIPDPDHLEHFSVSRERSQKKSTRTVVSSPQEAQEEPGSFAGPHDASSYQDAHQDREKKLTGSQGAGVSSLQGAQQVPGSFEGAGPFDASSRQDAKEPEPPMGTYTLPHPIWSKDQVHHVEITHKPPENFVDKMALMSVKLLRGGFDVFSGFIIGQRNEHKWVKRIIFLETVAGVPGMVAAMMRHMMSLRRLQRDHGWIHTLLEEAENERMHLMTALQLRKPSLFFRLAVIGSQGVFVTLFSLWYIVSPRFCHRFVGYLEEEAVKTYTKCLEDIEKGPLQHWQTQIAPSVAIHYWKLPEDAAMRDVILAIRADEAHHRVVNHTLASMKSDQFNPYKPGQ